MKMNFMLLKDSDEKCRKHSKSDNKETMTGFDTEELIQELLNHFFHRQVGLEQSMKGNEFLFDYIDGLHYIDTTLIWLNGLKTKM